MSLENLFTMPKKRDIRKTSNKPAANEAQANPDDEIECKLTNEEQPEFCPEPGKKSTNPTSKGMIVQQVTRNIEEMPDTKQRQKLDKLVNRLGTVWRIMQRHHGLSQR